MKLNKRLDAIIRYTGSTVWPAYAGCAWAILYAVLVRFYQAAGGTIGLPGEFVNPHAFAKASFAAGVLIMICGFILVALVKPWSRVVPEWMPAVGGRKVPWFVLTIPLLLCTAFALAHGMSGIITKSLHLAGFITMEFDSWIDLDVRSLALWDLGFYEPWFVIMGILSSLTGVHYAQACGVSPVVLRRTILVFLATVVLATALFVFEIIREFAVS
ncbi:DUF3995 domain-containing protein [Cohnella nanjingensis]|uniref:DUF3995 domain-containing protein n=1 Tax=Cohnella nanjingensis TaxID=1387779 RepID=A0A7X0RL58_9BACL|nr:DUF3995 domain-containing protein [Cohnella nanjingensis]MBB6669513.1 DUF3995 domain-containing protein [Cohnella nanjingensis]